MEIAPHSLPSAPLDAFYAVARLRHFSRAARRLGITQSALSQRVRNLEEMLGLTLFVRERGNVRPTEAAERLLRYCQDKAALEAEALGEMRGTAGELSGTIRIAGFSTIMRSLVLPSLAPLLRAHPRVELEFLSREMDELWELLRRAEVDFVLLDHRMRRENVTAVRLGEERNVLVRSKTFDCPADLFLDHDENDETTKRYFRSHGGGPRRLRRRYLDDIYGIIDGVRNGLGRAIVPRHLVAGDSELVIEAPERELTVPIYLHYFERPYYSRLHQAVITSLTARTLFRDAE